MTDRIGKEGNKTGKHASVNEIPAQVVKTLRSSRLLPKRIRKLLTQCKLKNRNGKWKKQSQYCVPSATSEFTTLKSPR